MEDEVKHEGIENKLGALNFMKITENYERRAQNFGFASRQQT